MSASNIRRRVSLLSGSAMLAALVMAGAGGVALAPTAALAANECTPVAPTLTAPGDNGATADTYLCAASYPSVSYSTNGAFTLQLRSNVTTTTGGVSITANGADAVTVSIPLDSSAGAGDPSLTSTTGAGLQVVSAAGGTIGVNLSDFFNDTTDAPLVVSGTGAGVLLQNAGAATTSFTTTNGAISASAGAGLDITSSGTGNVTVSSGSVVTGSTWGLRTGTTGAGNVAITNTNGTFAGGTGSILVTGGTNLTIANAAATPVNGGSPPTSLLNGILTLNNTGTVAITNSGRWVSTGTSFLGSGATTLTTTAATMAPMGVIATNTDGAATTIGFGGGADTFAQAGLLAVGGGTEGAATLTFTGLETWNNAGRIQFGAHSNGLDSDGAANDRVVSSGTTFTGSAASLLVMDVDFSADQGACSAAVTADCLDLRGSTTAGSTKIAVNVVGDPLVAADRIVLVDVAGAGTSAAGHFTLDVSGSNYRLIGTTPMVETGPYFYTLNYDAAVEQHVLEPVAFSGKALELARVGQAAVEPWRTVTGMWQDRQADLRDAVAGERVGPGAWIKLSTNVTNDTRFDFIDVGANEVGYNTSSHQETTAIVGGIDVVRMYDGDRAWVFGVTAGKIDSSLDYRVATSELELEGTAFGAYASVVSGRMFVDGIVNSTALDLTLSDFGRKFEGSAKSLGYQLEAGYRLFQVNDDGAYIEPIAALSSVSTEIDDLTIGSLGVGFEDASSLRAALGVRVAGDLVSDIVIARLSFTGRFWKELEGENQADLSAVFGKASFADAGVDKLGEAGVAVSLFQPGGRVSANLSYGLKFADGYESSNAAVSVRLSW